MSVTESGHRKKQAIGKKIEGIVRHYHTPDSNHCPYQGVLKTNNDEDSKITSLSQLLRDFPDGESITILIKSHGEHKNAKGFWWMLTKPHHYERVKKDVE